MSRCPNVPFRWVLPCLLFALSCSRPAGSSARFEVEAPPLPADRIPQESRALFASRCATCHGTGGRGDGPSAARLAQAPRDLTDRVWQSNVTNRRLRSVIVYGSVAAGLGAAMPGNPDLRDHPQVVDGLVSLVRGLSP